MNDPPGVHAPSSRSRADGDGRSDTNKVRHDLGNLAARESKASPKTHRRVGPTLAAPVAVSVEDDRYELSAISRSGTAPTPSGVIGQNGEGPNCSYCFALYR